MRLFKSFPCPVFTVVGNHDISQSISNLEKQPISVLSESGAVTLLTEGDRYEFENVVLQGWPYEEKRDNPDLAFFPEIVSNKFEIAIIHQMLLPDGESFFGDFINFHLFKDSGYNLVACGHYHPGYDPSVIKKYGIHFANVGSISRGSLDSHNITKIPKFLSCSVDKNNKFYSIEVTIPHVPYEQIFDLKKLESSKVKQQEMTKFISNLKELSEQTLDLATVNGLLIILKSLGADEELLSFSKQYLEEAADQL